VGSDSPDASSSSLAWAWAGELTKQAALTNENACASRLQRLSAIESLLAEMIQIVISAPFSKRRGMSRLMPVTKLDQNRA
jgi:hypothetical protein